MIDPNTGQTVINPQRFDQAYAGFLDPTMFGGLAAQQGQMGMQSQLAQAMLNRGYVPNSGFGGALAQMVQAAIGMKMLNDLQGKSAAMAQQQIEAINKAAQDKRKADREEQIFKEGLQEKQDAAKATAEAQAKKNFALPEFKSDAGVIYDPTTGKVTADAATQQFLMNKARAGAMQTTLNVGNEGFAKAAASQYEAAQQAAAKAQQYKALVSDLQSIQDAASTGKFAEAQAKIGQYIPIAGGEDAATSMQKFNAARAGMISSALEQMKGAGRVTQREFDAATAALPSFGTNPAANKFIYDMINRGADRDIATFESMKNYARQNPAEVSRTGFLGADLPNTNPLPSVNQAPQAKETEKVGNAPYPEGTKLAGPGGKQYVVKNGVPVPVDQ